MTRYTITEKATGNVLLSVDCPSTPEERMLSRWNVTKPSIYGLHFLYDVWADSAFDASTPNNTPIERDGFIFEFKDEL